MDRQELALGGTGPQQRPVGAITRGTTGINRLRRSDRFLVHSPLVRRALVTAADPLVVDLGYGASPATTLELAARLRLVAPGVRVLGLEIDPDRVVTGRDGVEFARGGFELAGTRPVLVRAFNVLRQYEEAEVPGAWALLRSRLAPGGLIVDGTCDELGRRVCFVLLDAGGPRSLTIIADPASLGRPSDVAERLPKALIHHNVPGAGIHGVLAELDRCWLTAAPLGVFGPRQRWRETLRLASLGPLGQHLAPQRRRLRDAVVTVPWQLVDPGRAPS